MKDLYLQERNSLNEFNAKLDQRKLKYGDIRRISEDYSGVLDQVALVTKVSDRLQRKLAEANNEILAKNQEIRSKNEELKQTLGKLAKAKLGRRASSIVLIVGLALLVVEEYLLDDYLSQLNIGGMIDVSLKIMIAVSMKFLESGLESYFLAQEKQKIMGSGKGFETSKK